MSETGELPRRGFVFGRLALAFVGLLAGLVVADLLAGALDDDRDLRRRGVLLVDERLGWVNHPRTVFPNGKTRVNSLGLRGADIPADASPTELRVLGVGASRTFGDLTEEDPLVWSAQLQRELRRKRIDARVLNGGVNGYSALQSARHAMDLVPVLRPDMVLLVIAPGSQVLLDSSSASEWVRVGDEVAPRDVVEAWPAAAAPLAVSLHKLLLNSNLYARYRARLAADEARSNALQRFIYTDRPRPPAAEERLERTWAELAELVATCAREEIELRAVLIPQRNQSDDRRWREWVLGSAKRGGPPFDTAREEPTIALTARLESLGLTVWDLTEVAERFGADEERFTVDGSHWTPAGHAVVAETLMERLQGEPQLVQRMIVRRRAAPRD